MDETEYRQKLETVIQHVGQMMRMNEEFLRLRSHADILLLTCLTTMLDALEKGEIDAVKEVLTNMANRYRRAIGEG